MLKPDDQLIPVEAAGGYVVRPDEGDVQLLMILRRGVWDLPKGKIDPGETPAECALREVAEETGAEGLAILRGAGMTLHTYKENSSTIIKTTWWFIMGTTSEDFVPEEREQIEEVKWVPRRRALEIVGYENLRRHLASLENVLTRIGRRSGDGSIGAD